MPKSRKYEVDEMPTYEGLSGSKVAIKRGSKADKIRIKKTQEIYDIGTKMSPEISPKINLKIAQRIGATVPAIQAEHNAKKSRLEKKFK